MDISIIPARQDNYIYLLQDQATGQTAVIDPGEAKPVADELEARGLSLDWIVNTHHHGDHIDGNDELKSRYGAKIIAPVYDRHRIPNVDQWFEDGDVFHLGDQQARVIHTPGHTSGHVSLSFDQRKALFSGDTLFALGCGRLFEGSPADMWQSLQRFSDLPDETDVFCGHEYTRSNLAFAQAVDPDNAALKKRGKEIEALLAAGKPTIPTNLGQERLCNPFLRPNDQDIRRNLGLMNEADVDVFAEIRRRKDNF